MPVSTGMAVSPGSDACLRVELRLRNDTVPLLVMPLTDPAPNALTFDSAGNLYVSDSFQGAVFKITNPESCAPDSLTITGYRELGSSMPERDPKRTGTREIYGTATTNYPGFAFVDFCVRVTDNGEPGDDDVFIIWVGFPGSPPAYRTDGPEDHTLGGTGQGGSNIQLHNRNPSNQGDWGGECGLQR